MKSSEMKSSFEKLEAKGFNGLYAIKGGQGDGVTRSANSKTVSFGNDADPCECEDSTK